MPGSFLCACLPIRYSFGAGLGLCWRTLTVLLLVGIHTRLYPQLFVILLLSMNVPSTRTASTPHGFWCKRTETKNILLETSFKASPQQALSSTWRSPPSWINFNDGPLPTMHCEGFQELPEWSWQLTRTELSASPSGDYWDGWTEQKGFNKLVPPNAICLNKLDIFGCVLGTKWYLSSK